MQKTSTVAADDESDDSRSVPLKQRVTRYLREEVFQLNFYRIHMSYFIVVILIGSAIFYGEGRANDLYEVNGDSKLRFIDALFMCCSAMTNTGLNVLNLGDLTAFQQFVLFFLMTVGSVPFVTLSVVLVRRSYFRRKVEDLTARGSARRHGKDAEDGHEAKENDVGKSAVSEPDPVLRNRQIRIVEAHPMHQAPARNLNLTRTATGNTTVKSQQSQSNNFQASFATKRRHSQSGFGSYPTPWQSKTVKDFLNYIPKRLAPTSSLPHTMSMRSYLSFEPQLDDRGRPRMLTRAQQDELGGVEYRALGALIWILVLYQASWYIFGIVCLVPYGYKNNVENVIRKSQPGNLNPGWWGLFNTFTSFTNCGLNVLDNGFESFYGEYFILIITGALTVAGNTQFPIFLRLTLWGVRKLVPNNSRVAEPLDYLLQHPRRCYTYLFPARETWYLFLTQFSIEATEWVLYEILNLGLPYMNTFTTGQRIIDGLFQGINLRTSGGIVVSLPSLAPALLITYLFAMYISSIPVILTLRKTNTYEEQSIGLEHTPGGGHGGLGVHLRHQLAYDLWFQGLAWVLICIVERGALMNAQPGFSLFTVLFEVVSAYGTVGLSLGLPTADYSLSGEFRILSKIVLLAVMLRGRHRGLPLAIDRSILLPGAKLMDEMDHAYNTGSEVSLGSASGRDWAGAMGVGGGRDFAEGIGGGRDFAEPTQNGLPQRSTTVSSNEPNETEQNNTTQSSMTGLSRGSNDA